MSPPLSLSDAELSAVMRLAEPVPRESRDAFLRALAAALSTYDAGAIGVGAIHCETVKLQKLYVNTTVGTSKYR